ncbi:hypothetical protein RI054_33g130300 [Pseudoscourfieldia marina]
MEERIVTAFLKCRGNDLATQLRALYRRKDQQEALATRQKLAAASTKSKRVSDSARSLVASPSNPDHRPRSAAHRTLARTDASAASRTLATSAEPNASAAPRTLATSRNQTHRRHLALLRHLAEPNASAAPRTLAASRNQTHRRHLALLRHLAEPNASAASRTLATSRGTKRIGGTSHSCDINRTNAGSDYLTLEKAQSRLHFDDDDDVASMTSDEDDE